MASDKHWAQAYINDPLTAPSPAMETGLGSSFRPDRSDSKQAASPTETASGSNLASNNPFRDQASPPRRTSKTHSRHTSSASNHAFPDLPGAGHTPHRGVIGAALNGGSSSPRRSPDSKDARRSLDSKEHRRSLDGIEGRPRRSSSLRGRFPGDNSHHPLEQLNHEHRKADRSPHLSKRHHHGRDSIDKLDDAGLGVPYHHEGPFDAASLARNNSYESSPIAALQSTNREALKATPKEKIDDAIERHRPLDGVAVYPPGSVDGMGRRVQYQEGTDMMREASPPGGAYKRYEDLEYDDNDLAGRGKLPPAKGKDFWEWERSRKGGAARHGEAVELSEGANVGLLGGDDNDHKGGSAATQEREVGEASGRHHRHHSGSNVVDGLKKRMGSLKLKGGRRGEED